MSSHWSFDDSPGVMLQFILSLMIRYLDFSMVLVHPSLPSYQHCWAVHSNPYTIKPSASSETSPYVSLLFICSHSL